MGHGNGVIVTLKKLLKYNCGIYYTCSKILLTENVFLLTPTLTLTLTLTVTLTQTLKHNYVFGLTK